jgi:hypothetical protein
MSWDEILLREDQAWSALDAAVARLSPAQRRTEGVVPGWSADDLVWHCAKWAEFTVERLAAMAEGAFTDPFAAESDEYWEAENQALAVRSKAMSSDEIDAGAASTRTRIREIVAAFGERGPEAESLLVEETSVHYDEHTAEIRRFLDAQA